MGFLSSINPFSGGGGGGGSGNSGFQQTGGQGGFFNKAQENATESSTESVGVSQGGYAFGRNSTVNLSDPGALDFGLKTVIASLDLVGHDLDLAHADSATSQKTAAGAISGASSLAAGVSQGQQNTSLKYLLIGVAVLAAIGVGYRYVSKN